MAAFSTDAVREISRVERAQLSHLSLSPVVLLIGSTGSGKSTLGNFLLNPDISMKTPFRPARSNRPETRRVQCATDNLDNPTIQVIDTPGLNEGAFEDLAHMKDVVRTLRSLHYISACILCLRFNSKIDAQWKATVAYYKQLLPMLFEGNVVIVITDYHTDERSIRQREVQGIDVDEAARNVLTAVVDSGGEGLTYKPQVFLINGMPIDESDREQSEGDREAILRYIRECMVPVRVSDLKVAKTDALKLKDQEEMSRMDGEIVGYKERLQEIQTNAKNVLDLIELTEKQTSQAEERIASQKAELAYRDSGDTVIAEIWSLKEKYKLLRWQTKEFKCESRWPIAGYMVWDNGQLEWKDFTVSKYSVTGKVEGRFMRGLYANVTLKTRMCDKYADRIRELQASIRKEEERLASLASNLENIHKEQKEHKQEVDLLMAFILEKKERKKAISQSHLDLEEVELRLQELQIT